MEQMKIQKQYTLHEREVVSNWCSDVDPQVSIIILNWNKSQLTIECLNGIWMHTRGFRYEIVVVDNGSRLEEFDILKRFRGFYKLVRLEVNRFFGEGNNIGAELAQGEFIAFMNNDVIVTADWLQPLMNAFRAHSDCGAAGPKFIYPSGLLQEAGALLDENGNSVQIGKFQDPKDPQYSRERLVDYVSAATVVMRREVFEQVLGFDFVYEPAYYEDVDLCLKLGQKGLRTYYIPESCVVHHENATTSDASNGLNLPNIVAVNREKFTQRWTDYLQTGVHGPENRPRALIGGDTGTGVPTAAVFTPYNINLGGGERYLLSLAEALLQAGYETWLLTSEKYSSIRISQISGIFGLELQGINVSTIDTIEERIPFDVFITVTNQVTPPVKAIGKKVIFLCQLPFPCDDAELSRASEWLSDYDSLVVYSDFARQHLSRLVLNSGIPQVSMEIISPAVDMIPAHEKTSRCRIVSVGRFSTGTHCKQQILFINVLRRMKELGIEAELHLVGFLPTEVEHREYLIECQRLSQDLPVHFYINASAAILQSLYVRASIYWHGAGFGVDADCSPEKCEQFGVTVVEAMSAGVVPIVVNNGGPASIVEHGVSGYFYDSEDGLILRTLDILYADDSELAKLRNNCRDRALNFSKSAFRDSWRNLLDKLEI